jgi:hypothetical protein
MGGEIFMRVCVIGNSQIAAIKGGWDMVRHTQPGVEVTFFGATRNFWPGLKPIDGALVATTPQLREGMAYTSGGLDRITDTYDRFLVCSCGVGAPEFLKFYDTDRKQALSDDFEMLAAEALKDTIGMRLMEQLQQTMTAPVGLIPTPFHSDDAPEDSYGVTLKWGALQKLPQKYEDTLSLLAEERGFQLYLQPLATIARPLHTKAMFSIGSTKLHSDNKQHQVDDFTHMNAKYGVLCWAEILTDHMFLGAS